MELNESLKPLLHRKMSLELHVLFAYVLVSSCLRIKEPYMKKILLMSLALALTGCASSGLVGELPVVKDPSNAGKVVAMRVGLFGADPGCEILFDDKLLATIQKNKYTEFYVPPGNHSISQKQGRYKETREFSINPRETKYFLLGISLTRSKTGRGLAVDEIEEAKGSRMLSYFEKFELKKE